MTGRARWICGATVSIAGMSAVLLALGAVWCEKITSSPKAIAELGQTAKSLPPSVTRRDVRITASDGAVLHAWLLRPERSNGDCVLTLHGSGTNRASLIEPVNMFLSAGYTVLAPDSRGDGESEGMVTQSQREADDVHQWVSSLIASEHPRHVFGIGESLGASVLLESLAVEPRFNAVVAEAPFADFQPSARTHLAQRLPVPAALGEAVVAPVIWAGFLYAQLRYGIDYWHDSPAAILPHVSTPVLLIHGLNDTVIPPWHSQALAAANPWITTLWLVPGARHMEAIHAAPEEFRRRVLGWFSGHAAGMQAN